MSELAKGQAVRYQPVRVRIIQCTSPAPRCWYREYVGQVFSVSRKTWYQDGEVTGQSYEMKQTPGGGLNGHLMTEDVEEIGQSDTERTAE